MPDVLCTRVLVAYGRSGINIIIQDGQFDLSGQVVSKNSWSWEGTVTMVTMGAFFPPFSDTSNDLRAIIKLPY